MRMSITSGRPIRIGFASPSSTAICVARSTRSSSPSAKITRFGARFAAWNTGLMIVAEWYTNELSRSR